VNRSDRARLALRPTVFAVVGLCVAVLGVALVGAPDAVAMTRMRFDGNATLEQLAERVYGDPGRAAVLRAGNKINDGEQPAVGTLLKVPGSTLHTVSAGETLQKVADRFLAGEGGAALLAEMNGLTPTAALKPGQVLTVFDEIEVRTNNRSAEDIAALFLGDPNLGARLRRYNGVRDGAKLPGRIYVPLAGLSARSGSEPVPGAAPRVAVGATPVPSSPAAASPAVTTTPATAAPVSPPAAAPVSPPAAVPVSPTTAAVVSPPHPVTSSVPSPAAVAVATGTPTEGYPVTSKLAALLGFTHALHTPMVVNGQPVSCLTCHEHADPQGHGVMPPTQANCLLCHRRAEEMPASIRKGQVRRLPLPMNHQLHVGQNQIDCSVCHLQEPERPLGMATQGHEACAACHTAGGIPPFVQGDPQGASCKVCHGSAEESPVSAERQRFLRSHMVRSFGRIGDVTFTHLTHATFSPGGSPGGTGPAMDCRTCHADAWNAETKEQIGRVGMQGCMECHRQSSNLGLQPPQDCAGCHLNQRAGHQPMNEMVLTKPLDHTAFFRRNHQDAAREHAPMCASCHAGVDPSDGNRCDTCHLVMKPRDHTAGYRDRIHGRMAQVDATRCTTCHRAERCEACHREPPRSHFPRNVWVEKGLHGARGRLELGACLTCHRFEQTCSRCHTATQK
jgi:LysM repeat protein